MYHPSYWYREVSIFFIGMWLNFFLFFTCRQTWLILITQICVGMLGSGMNWPPRERRAAILPWQPCSSSCSPRLGPWGDAGRGLWPRGVFGGGAGRLVHQRIRNRMESSDTEPSHSNQTQRRDIHGYVCQESHMGKHFRHSLSTFLLFSPRMVFFFFFFPPWRINARMMIVLFG